MVATIPTFAASTSSPNEGDHEHTEDVDSRWNFTPRRLGNNWDWHTMVKELRNPDTSQEMPSPPTAHFEIVRLVPGGRK